MKKDGFISMIVENIIESFIALVYILVFVLSAIVSSYFIENKQIIDILISSATIIGMISLIVISLKRPSS